MTVKMMDSYETSDGKTFTDAINAQTHEARADMESALKKLSANRSDDVLKGWMQEHKGIVSNFLYPHNVDIKRQDMK